MNARLGTVGTLGRLSTYTRAHAYPYKGRSIPTVPTPPPPRWHLIRRRLAAPSAESRRLAALLERLRAAEAELEHLEHFEDYRRIRARVHTSIEEEVFQVFQLPASADRWPPIVAPLRSRLPSFAGSANECSRNQGGGR